MKTIKKLANDKKKSGSLEGTINKRGAAQEFCTVLLHQVWFYIFLCVTDSKPAEFPIWVRLSTSELTLSSGPEKDSLLEY